MGVIVPVVTFLVIVKVECGELWLRLLSEDLTLFSARVNWSAGNTKGLLR